MGKIFYFDTETTGLSASKNSIHQIAGIIEIDDQVVEEFNIKMQPIEMADLPESYVTPVGGITKQMMLSYATQQEGFKKLTSILEKYVDRFDKKDKFFVAGYNCQAFDMSFLRAFFDFNQNSYFGAWFWSATLDVMILASYYTQNQRKELANFKLETVAKYFGLTVSGEGFHDAMSDVRITRQLLKVVDL